MRVLVVGSGAREHALAWKLAQSPRVDQVLCAPGNGGTGAVAENLAIGVTELVALADAARARQVDLTVVGPEVPLAAGIVDLFEARGLKIFGPSQAAARIESSKAWSKELLLKYGVPTARAETVGTEAEARRAAFKFGLPVVLKADGLAAGKGVWVVQTVAQLEEALEALFRARTLGAASDQVLVEECLTGPEVSTMLFTDGERIAVMPAARDYKRLRDGNQGPNTGGMGGYSRPADATPEVMADAERRIMRPILDAMAREGQPYKGVLYPGLMLTADGPRVLEFNCRFGDPECELLLPLLESDLADVCLQVAEGRLDPATVRWRDGATCGVVLAAAGYPEQPRTGDVIDGLDRVPPDVHVFHAGTAPKDGELVTSGGRVLTVVAAGDSVAQARARVYAALPAIHFAGQQYRGDIAAVESGAVPVPAT